MLKLRPNGLYRLKCGAVIKAPLRINGYNARCLVLKEGTTGHFNVGAAWLWNNHDGLYSGAYESEPGYYGHIVEEILP